MIVFELICTRKHRFEGWFASAGDFDGQKARGLLECPVCSDKQVDKLLTAKIRKAAPVQAPQPARPATASKGTAVAVAGGPQVKDLGELVAYILSNTEDVGAEFANEARRIHYEQAPERAIRGVATREQTEELLDEGISVAQLPVPPQSDWH